MKKLLLATTAVAGLALMPAAAHAEIDLDLGGYFKGYAGFTDQDTNGVSDFGIRRESEIHINGETTLDNGLTVGARFEIQTEADGVQFNDLNADGLVQAGELTDTGDQFEESYIYFSGNWGRVNFGAEDGAAYLLQVAAPSADSNIDGIDPDIEFVNFAGTVITPLNYELAPTQDADKVTYLTPKVAGFQAGVSWASDSIQDGLFSGLGGQDANETTSAAGTLHDVIEVSARYDGDIDGIGIHAGGGYVTAQQSNATASPDYDGWNVGLKFDVAGFGLGASYSEQENFVGNEDSEVLVVGADYQLGAYKLGASYFNSETDVGAATDEVERYSVGAGYSYGPGLSFRGSVHVYDIEDSATPASNNDAVAVVLGTDIQF